MSTDPQAIAVRKLTLDHTLEVVNRAAITLTAAITRTRSADAALVFEESQSEKIAVRRSSVRDDWELSDALGSARAAAIVLAAEITRARARDADFILGKAKAKSIANSEIKK